MERVSVRLMGEAVRYHRRRAELSQLDLADLASVGKTSVFDIEKGKPTVRLATLVAVLRVLNIDLTMDGPLMNEFVSTRSDGEDGIL
ncbi:MAG: HTH-type transcriptional regulator/antitoxin HipB [Candidatus Promineifilaceae bacterium]|jgi:HTH-type transcriptional regulator/antitoxin HipB